MWVFFENAVHPEKGCTDGFVKSASLLHKLFYGEIILDFANCTNEFKRSIESDRLGPQNLQCRKGYREPQTRWQHFICTETEPIVYTVSDYFNIAENFMHVVATSPKFAEMRSIFISSLCNMITSFVETTQIPESPDDINAFFYESTPGSPAFNFTLASVDCHTTFSKFLQ